MSQAQFPVAPDLAALERGSVLAPRFDAAGLIAAVVTHAQTGEVLMLAWMDAPALRRTLDTGEAHFFSRSRQAPWKKGETSGQVQTAATAAPATSASAPASTARSRAARW